MSGDTDRAVEAGLRKQLPRLQRVARAAMNTYVGVNWPSMETLRVNGLSVDFAEKRAKDPAIRRFISEFSPEFVLDLLDVLSGSPRSDTALDVIMPCRNCGEELYDSITLRWDHKVPRCPRCAADQRYPIPSIEDQMRESGFLSSPTPEREQG